MTTRCTNTTYSTSGLSRVLPPVASFDSIARRTGGANVCQGHLVTPQGWNPEQGIMPIERLKSDQVMVECAAVPCGAHQNAVDLSIGRRVDPVVSPSPAEGSVIRARPGDAIGINSQPLPLPATLPVQPPAGPVPR